MCIMPILRIDFSEQLRQRGIQSFSFKGIGSFNEERIGEKDSVIRCVQVILIVTGPEFPTSIVRVYLDHRPGKVI